MTENIVLIPFEIHKMDELSLAQRTTEVLGEIMPLCRIRLDIEKERKKMTTIKMRDQKCSSKVSLKIGH